MVNKSEELKDIFPLRIVEFTQYAGMGEYEFRYKLLLNNGQEICRCDYAPKFVKLINSAIKPFID